MFKETGMEEFDALEFLEHIKKKNGWSVEKLAQEIGVHSQTLGGWLRGDYKPSPLAKKMIGEFIKKYL